MNGHGLQFLEMLNLLEFCDVCDEVAMDVECLKLWEVFEIIVQMQEIVMGDVDPL